MEIKALNSLPKEEYINALKQIIALALQERENLNLKTKENLILFLRNLILQNTYVILENGKVIGFVNFGHNTKNFPQLSYIRAVVVRKDQRGNGIGKQLLNYAIQQMLHPIWILVNETNAAMQSLLPKLGFVPWIKKNGQLAFIKIC